MLLQTEQIYKMASILLKMVKLLFWVKIVVILSVALLVSTVIFFSAWDKPHVKSLVTQPMIQRPPNPTKLRLMDYYIQILCRFQKSKCQVPPPSIPVLNNHPLPQKRKIFLILSFVNQIFTKVDSSANICTGKSLSEALIYLSINPQYNNRLFNDLWVQYEKITRAEHVSNMLQGVS